MFFLKEALKLLPRNQLWKTRTKYHPNLLLKKKKNSEKQAFLRKAETGKVKLFQAHPSSSCQAVNYLLTLFSD